MFFETLSSALPRALITKCFDSALCRRAAALSEDSDYSMPFGVVNTRACAHGSTATLTADSVRE
jgi:hypothetical protein